MITPLKFLKALNKSDMYIHHIYTKGGCFQLFLLLQQMYPSAIAYINKTKTHVITEIDGIRYDINGEVSDFDQYLEGGYKKLTKAQFKKCGEWSFYKHNVLTVSCPECAEDVALEL